MAAPVLATRGERTYVIAAISIAGPHNASRWRRRDAVVNAILRVSRRLTAALFQAGEAS